MTEEMNPDKTLDRLEPWYTLMDPEAVVTLKSGGRVNKADDLGKLASATVSVRVLPDPPAKQFEAMNLVPLGCSDGVVNFATISSRSTIKLVFAMDVANGRIHTLLDEGGMKPANEIAEEDVEDYTRYFYSVLANRTVELSIQGAEPIDCEAVIPSNIIPRVPEEAVKQALEQFRLFKQQSNSAEPDWDTV